MCTQTAYSIKSGGGGIAPTSPFPQVYTLHSSCVAAPAAPSALCLQRFGPARTCHGLAPASGRCQGDDRENRTRRVRFLPCWRIGDVDVRPPSRIWYRHETYYLTAELREDQQSPTANYVAASPDPGARPRSTSAMAWRR